MFDNYIRIFARLDPIELFPGRDGEGGIQRDGEFSMKLLSI